MHSRTSNIHFVLVHCNMHLWLVWMTPVPEVLSLSDRMKYCTNCKHLHAWCVLYSYCLYQGQFCFAVLLCMLCSWGGGGGERLRGALWLWLWLIWCLSPRINIQLHTICRPHSGPSHRERFKRREREMWWREGGMERGIGIVALKEVRAGDGLKCSLMPWYEKGEVWGEVREEKRSGRGRD